MATTDRPAAGPRSRTHTGAHAGEKEERCTRSSAASSLLFLVIFIILFQEGEKECVGPTASSLLGVAAASLGRLGAPLQEDVEALEGLRSRLQADWKLLQTTGPGFSKSLIRI